MTVSEQLREAIRQSGLTHYRIGKDTGLVIRTIDRFVTEGTPTHSDTFDALCDYFGLELCPKKAGTGQKQPAKKAATKRKQATKKTAGKRRKKAGE